MSKQSMTQFMFEHLFSIILGVRFFLKKIHLSSNGSAHFRKQQNMDEVEESGLLKKPALRKNPLLKLCLLIIAVVGITTGFVWGIPSGVRKELWYDLNITNRSHFEDDTWIGVIRMSTSCSVLFPQNTPYSEGLTTLILNMPQDPPVRYGCWFFVATFSKVKVFTGKIFRAESPAHLKRALNTTCDANDWCDTEWCSAASARGYDSVLVWREYPQKHFLPEFVVCHGECMTQPLTTACPNISMRDSYDRTCRCDARSNVLNCDGQVASCDTAKMIMTDVIRLDAQRGSE